MDISGEDAKERFSPVDRTQRAPSLVGSHIVSARETAELVRAAENDMSAIMSREQEVDAKRADLQAQAEEVLYQLVVAQKEEQAAVTALQAVIDKEDAARRDVAMAAEAVARANAILARNNAVFDAALAERRVNEAALAPIFIKVRSLQTEQGRFMQLAESEVAQHQAELALKKVQLWNHRIALSEVQIQLLSDPSAEECWAELKGVIGGC